VTLFHSDSESTRSNSPRDRPIVDHSSLSEQPFQPTSFVTVCDSQIGRQRNRVVEAVM